MNRPVVLFDCCFEGISQKLISTMRKATRWQQSWSAMSTILVFWVCRHGWRNTTRNQCWSGMLEKCTRYATHVISGWHILLIAMFLVFQKDKDYLELTCNVFQFNVIARKALHTMKDRVGDMDVTVGWLIQGDTDDELPERVRCTTPT